MLEWIRGSVWERVYGRKCMGGRECMGVEKGVAKV